MKRHCNTDSAITQLNSTIIHYDTTVVITHRVMSISNYFFRYCTSPSVLKLLSQGVLHVHSSWLQQLWLHHHFTYSNMFCPSLQNSLFVYNNSCKFSL